MSQQRVVSTYFLRGFMEPRWHDLWTPLYIVSAEHQPLLDPLITLQHVTKRQRDCAKVQRQVQFALKQTDKPKLEFVKYEK